MTTLLAYVYETYSAENGYTIPTVKFSHW